MSASEMHACFALPTSFQRSINQPANPLAGFFAPFRNEEWVEMGVEK
jgi:hypothetical protein